ncbi:MAG: TerD family protein [Desulfotomaculum sp.]|nr:TerD family protein [Desulfotomaculum sp.]
MSINLQKGQKVDLTKGSGGLSSLIVGLGWDPVQQKSTGGGGGGGFLGKILGGGGGSAEVDCDASILMLNTDSKLTRKEDLIYYGNLKSSCDSVQHTGDNLTGEGEGDDEQVIIELSRIPANIHKLVFVVNIYDCQRRKQDFGLIQNAFIRVVNKSNNQELIKFNLSDDYAGLTTLITGEIYRHNNEWKFNAIGQGTNDISLSEVAKKYQ